MPSTPPGRLRLKAGLITALAALLMAGCATQQAGYDYSAFKQNRPASILVLPPLNSSMEVDATYSVLSQVTLPLAESGYYVFPVSLVDETFRQNGMHNPGEMHGVALARLHEIFGADAALYIDIKQYGTTYAVISSESRVTAEARLIDLRSEQTLWQGSATASSAEGRNSNGGLVGLLITAVVNQIIETTTNKSHPVAGIATYRLLSAGMPNGILYGPRSPKYQQEGTPR
ncbi:DUF799 domain-containing protein [Thauera linaloolentis]|uniref:Lipoprotein n=1 Tax=Thauera linaloolentis (strain DSM 12138 / JCM 21573 / CCUG 41526 / CIP 105981 / IAM 15112 / NBRC 102519 / 47Lol) TaxID=1123367 RepID=N6Y786_THAL4|nr:DUF799 domain-containing protein [Thauera linaloolentis]ENO87415.1 hypothetical protein C666_10995 [Thauera linaloolentis 47Lol = DSM 12138]MCM8565065.1 DUF799 domain-containing protein [Thauera linaloolentis]